MALVGTYSPLPVGGERVLSLDFTAELTAGDSVASATAAIVVSPVSQTSDPSAASLAIGSTTVTGNVVSQNVGGAGVPGVIYALIFTANTAKGETLIDFGRLSFTANG